MSKTPKIPKMPYGEGSFSWNEAKGMFRYRKRIGKKKRPVDVYGETANACLRLMKEKEEEQKKKDRLNNPELGINYVILQDGLLHWLRTSRYQTGDLKPSSYDRMESIYNTWIKDSDIGRTAIINIRRSEIQELLNRAARQRSLSTVKKIYGLLKMYCDYYFEGDPSQSPMNGVKLPKPDRLKRQQDHGRTDEYQELPDADGHYILDDDEIERFEAECMKTPVPGKPGTKYGPLFLFLIWTMARYGELLPVRLCDIKGETLHITRAYHKIQTRDSKGKSTQKYIWQEDDPKTASGYRTIDLFYKAQQALQDHIDRTFDEPPKDTDLLFTTSGGEPVSNQYLNKNLQQVLKRADIHKPISLHGLRHTGASYYIRHGVPIEVVSRMLGHSDITTTLRVYYHVIESQKHSAIQDLAEREKNAEMGQKSPKSDG